MNAPLNCRILVGSDNADDVEVVCNLLRPAFPYVESSVEPASLAAHFDRLRPQVLLLAYQKIESAQRTCVTLREESTVIATLPHRCVLLCSKDELRLAYQLCCEQRFDDYVLFWPLAHDARRLPMSVHLALRTLDDSRVAALLQQVQAQSLQIAQLESERDALNVLLRVRPPAEARPADVTDVSAAPKTPDDSPTRPSLLLVEDDPFLSKLLARMLEDAGYDVATAATGAEAISWANASRPALVLMDVMLPDMNGIEAMRRIKAREHCAGVPVVMLTGHSHKEVIIESRAAGAVDFLVKPVKREKLLMKLARNLTPPPATCAG